jgi:hypothetical protein
LLATATSVVGASHDPDGWLPDDDPDDPAGGPGAGVRSSETSPPQAEAQPEIAKKMMENPPRLMTPFLWHEVRA